MPSFLDALKGKTIHFSKVIIPSLSRLVVERDKYAQEGIQTLEIIFSELGEAVGEFYMKSYHNKVKTSLNLHVKNINPRNAEFLTISLSSLLVIQLLTDFENSLDFDNPDTEKFIDYIEEKFNLSLLEHEDKKYKELWEFYLNNDKQIIKAFDTCWYEFYWNEILGLPSKKHVLPDDNTMHSEDLAMLTIMFSYILDDFRVKVANRLGV